MREYEEQEYGEQPDRLVRLLLRLPALRALSPEIMEELFFAGLIGNVQIDSIIPYILKMETGEYNTQMGLSSAQQIVCNSTDSVVAEQVLVMEENEDEFEEEEEGEMHIITSSQTVSSTSPTSSTTLPNAIISL